MAIARVAKGTTLKVDTSATAGPYNVGLPAGHVSGHLLFLFVTTDDNTNTTADPSGWTRLYYVTNGSSIASPYTPRVRTKCYYRIDNGSLGSTVTLSFDTSSSWPTGKPSVIAYTVAYSGCDQTSPIENWDFVSTTSTATAEAHPQMTTVTANAWLLSFRAVSTDSPGATFTCSVGTDTEVQDDFDTIPELATALYDSNAALTAGLQTQRTTTASRAATYGGLATSIVIKPASASNAVFATPSTATISFAAKSAIAVPVNGPWDACAAGGMPVYTTAIDWAGNGTFTDPGDDVTPDDLSGGITITYGRDQARQLSPGAAGSMTFAVNNSSRKYSPENSASALYGNLDPARNAQAKVVFQGSTTYLFTGRIDDFDVRADFGDRTVSFSFLDSLALMNGIKLSTPLYQTIRTGEAVNVILDAIGWTGPRDIDAGATVIPFWWLEGTDAFTALQDLVKSEGPPSIAYQAPDGTFIFRDRHHRLMRSQSRTSQARFAAPARGDCSSPAVTGLSFIEPFTYSNGWKDIVNSVSFDVDVRQPDLELSAVWSSSDTISLANGESRVIDVSGGDPFMNAVTPVVGTDFTLSGAGTVLVQLDRTSGASATIVLTAVGGAVQVLSLQLRAQAVRIVNTVKVTLQDGVSIGEHGRKDYPDSAPWAGTNDAYALATLIIQRYSERLPTVLLSVAAKDPQHWQHIVGRTIGDRIAIQHNELGMNADFFIESITHSIQRIWTDRPPVHTVVFGCEKCPDSAPANPLTFDKRGAGFDDGVFNPVVSDDPGTIWIWDDPVQGTFDGGLFAT
jgi:hypothetical protein